MVYINKILSSEFIRYIVGGAVNTFLGWFIYLFFLLLMPYQIAYSTAYVCGVFMSYYINSRFVFNQPLDWKKALQYPLVYVVQYIAGITFLTLLVEVFNFPETLAPLAGVLLTLPITFLLSRFIIAGKAKPQPDEPAETQR